MEGETLFDLTFKLKEEEQNYYKGELIDTYTGESIVLKILVKEKVGICKSIFWRKKEDGIFFFRMGEKRVSVKAILEDIFKRLRISIDTIELPDEYCLQSRLRKRQESEWDSEDRCLEENKVGTWEDDNLWVE
jgi:hypothetical protein